MFSTAGHPSDWLRTSLRSVPFGTLAPTPHALAAPVVSEVPPMGFNFSGHTASDAESLRTVVGQLRTVVRWVETPAPGPRGCRVARTRGCRVRTPYRRTTRAAGDRRRSGVAARRVRALGERGSSGGEGTAAGEIVVHPGDGLRTVPPRPVRRQPPLPVRRVRDVGLLGRRVSPLRAPVLERRLHRDAFPGGSVANPYHWTRAIGPPSQRDLNVHGHTGEPLTNELRPRRVRLVCEQPRHSGDDAGELRHRDRPGGGRLGRVHERPRRHQPQRRVRMGGPARHATDIRRPYHAETGRSATSSTSPGQSFWMGGGSLAERTRKYISAAPRRSTTSASGRARIHRIGRGQRRLRQPAIR